MTNEAWTREDVERHRVTESYELRAMNVGKWDEFEVHREIRRALVVGG